MIKQIVASLAFAALSVASAATYKVSLVDSSAANGAKFKAGDYQMDVRDKSVVVKVGRQHVEVPAKIENTNQQYNRTHVIYHQKDGKYVIEEIELGGTSTKVTFDTGVQTGGGE